MFQTKITELFGIRYPLVVGTMMHLAKAELVAAASQAGALGVLASAMFTTQEDFRKEIRRVKDRTDKPFAVNLNLFPMARPVDNREYLEVIFDEGVRIVETSGHKAPDDLARDLKSRGVILVHKCVGVRYAQKAQAIGADAVTVVGYENGGATGTLDVTTLCLVPRVVDSVQIPVIGGGGVTDGRGFLALLALGAQGVIIGTAALVAEECPIHPDLKKALLEASELDTMVIMRTIQNSHRVWINETTRKVAELESRQAGLAEIIKVAGGDKAKKMYQEGDIQAGVMSCGQGVGLVKKIRPMKDIIEGIVAQAADLRQKLSII
ncbi:MAG: nitronate monooxygenase family protein [Desulfobacterota bacterium]|nr:nitronate monooxygenase family protein [Thermodesulfobacteriota bacterium]